MRKAAKSSSDKQDGHVASETVIKFIGSIPTTDLFLSGVVSHQIVLEEDAAASTGSVFTSSTENCEM